MKHVHIFSILLIAFTHISCKSLSQNQKESTIAFYNVENLFDTINDPSINDEDFLPQGKNEWNSARYTEKLGHINEVISLMPNPLLIGVCEIENANVVRDVIRTSPKYSRTFGLVHYDSPDERGIDVALMYDSLRLTLVNSGIIRFEIPKENGSTDHTRDILWAQLSTGKNSFYAMVNHWPSRSGGQEASDKNRVLAAQNARKFIDSLLLQDENTNIILMGDLNDYPNNTAPLLIEEKLNPMISKSSGEFAGTYNYRGEWDVLDHIYVSDHFFKNKKIKVLEDSGKILSPTFLQEVYKGDTVPFRTYAGKKYLGGYSDHFPVCVSVKFP